MMNGKSKATSDKAAPPAAEPVTTFKCNKCGREFGSAIALQTHVTRAHKKFWSTHGKTPKAQSKPQFLGRPRSELNPLYLKYRDRYRARGLNSKGKPYKTYKRGKKYMCPICNEEFPNPGNVGNHMLMTHGQSLKEFRNGEHRTIPRRVKDNVIL